jgi:hypothetical protein
VQAWLGRVRNKAFIGVKHWEIMADNLSRAGWSWGCVSVLDSEGRTVFVADAHRDDRKRFVLHADKKLTAFVELELAIRAVNYNSSLGGPSKRSYP